MGGRRFCEAYHECCGLTKCLRAEGLHKPGRRKFYAFKLQGMCGDQNDCTGPQYTAKECVKLPGCFMSQEDGELKCRSKLFDGVQDMHTCDLPSGAFSNQLMKIANRRDWHHWHRHKHIQLLTRQLRYTQINGMSKAS